MTKNFVWEVIQMRIQYWWYRFPHSFMVNMTNWPVLACRNKKEIKLEKLENTDADTMWGKKLYPIN